MSKFDRKSQQLKARVQFVRGVLQKDKDDVLSDAEADALSDDAIDELLGKGGPLQAVDRKPAGKAGEGGGAA